MISWSRRKLPSAGLAVGAACLFFSTLAGAFTPRLSALEPFSKTQCCRPSSALAESGGEEDAEASRRFVVTRRDAAGSAVAVALSAGLALGVRPDAAGAKCADIDSCREIGERKVEVDMRENPTFTLPGGVRYKVLRRPLDETDPAVVSDGSSIDLIFSVNAQGAYMYSRGFGYEKVDFGDGRRVSDLGLDSLRVMVGRRDVPLGIERALIGMRRGERRRVEVPPSVGFETSDWEPAPTTRRGKASIKGYQQILEGRGSNQPPFPAVTIWDIEVLKIRS